MFVFRSTQGLKLTQARNQDFIWLCLGGLGLSIWAAFIGWASFYHCGGKEAGLQKAT